MAIANESTLRNVNSTSSEENPFYTSRPLSEGQEPVVFFGHELQHGHGSITRHTPTVSEEAREDSFYSTLTQQQ